MQKKAVLLLLSGSALTIPWVWLLFHLMYASEEIVVPLNPAGALLLVAIILGPGMLAAYIANRMRRIVSLRCRKCNWAQGYLIDKPRYRT